MNAELVIYGYYHLKMSWPCEHAVYSVMLSTQTKMCGTGSIRDRLGFLMVYEMGANRASIEIWILLICSGNCSL